MIIEPKINNDAKQGLAQHVVLADDRYSPYGIVTTNPASARSRVLKCGDSLALLDPSGQIRTNEDEAPSDGFYYEDTRFLSKLVVALDGVPPVLLSSMLAADNTSLEVDLTNADLFGDHPRLERGSLHLRKSTVVGDGVLFETIELRNFSADPLSIGLTVGYDADFVDMFEVRGTQRERRGENLPQQLDEAGPVLGYRGLDDIVRRTRLSFDPRPQQVEQGSVWWQIRLQPGERHTIRLEARCERDDRAPLSISHADALAAAQRRIAESKKRVASVRSNNAGFDDWLERSRADLDMLISDTPQGLYPYAGIPWFATAFGRDGLITALECLWLDPELAAGTLRFLAANQATEVDPRAAAEPGKILHETRKGEMASLGEVPSAKYYGSADATPLFVMLAAAYHARTGDTELIHTLWPNIEAALLWMSKYGDVDGDGFIEYGGREHLGLANQGWKDSGDSIFHEDGPLAVAPIALAEIQAYAYAAYVGAARLAEVLGFPDRAATLAATAQDLKVRFEAAYWLDDLGTYALALDRDKRPCRVRASNAGHVLFAGLASPERALRVAQNLMAEDAFSLWGIRTVATDAARYNPMSYHNGSVWPHDNALIAMGFARYGFKEPLLQILTGMFNAVSFMEPKRLPELFCGFKRRAGAGPTAYPVACIPQAWAAASVYALLGAALGVFFVPEARQIQFARPQLPAWLPQLEVSNLRLGDASVDLVLERSSEGVAMHVTRRDGAVEIVLSM